MFGHVWMKTQRFLPSWVWVSRILRLGHIFSIIQLPLSPTYIRLHPTVLLWLQWLVSYDSNYDESLLSWGSPFGGPGHNPPGACQPNGSTVEDEAQEIRQLKKKTLKGKSGGKTRSKMGMTFKAEKQVRTAVGSCLYNYSFVVDSYHAYTLACSQRGLLQMQFLSTPSHSRKLSGTPGTTLQKHLPIQHASGMSLGG